MNPHARVVSETLPTLHGRRMSFQMVDARPVAEGTDAAEFWPLARRLGPKQIQQIHVGQRVAARLRVLNVRLKRAAERRSSPAPPAEGGSRVGWNDVLGCCIAASSCRYALVGALC
jgi:hypothetical protein